MNKYSTYSYTLFLLAFLLFQCKGRTPQPEQLRHILADVESITGRSEYLNSPYVTAGDRIYMVGHQNGQFPDLGWHVPGEMGGIWDHPIKLMDGFTAAIRIDEKSYCLSEADTFINYPFANKHVFSSTAKDLRIERTQFVPDGKEAIVIAYAFINQGEETKTFTFEFSGHTDLRPVWLGERSGMEDAEDTVYWESSLQSWFAKDQANDWFAIFGSTIVPESFQKASIDCEYTPQGKGKQASLSFAGEVPPHATVTIPITIAGSYVSEQQAADTYEEVRNTTALLLKEKKERYHSIAQKTKLTLPDKEFEQAFRWVKYNTDWLIRDVPEVGRGLSAGLPDYPWWFGVDNEYALQGAIMTGQKALVDSTIALIHRISENANGNGRIVHEVSTNGVVFNPGNVNETPQFASLIWKVYQWTGDTTLLQKYYPTVKQGLAWLLEENDEDGNMLPDGFGMMEIHGLNSEMIDVAVYTQKAFADAASMAEVMGENELVQQYRTRAAQLKQKINTDFWVQPYKSYADFIGTTQQARLLIEDAIHRADSLNKPWAVKELQATKAQLLNKAPQDKRGFVLHHNWVVNTPMETGIADTAKALLALETGSRFVNPFGMFVTGIDRDETAGEDESSFAQVKKTFSYTGAVMTLPTGVQAIAENNYGRPDEALGYLQRMTRTFSFALPGSVYEVSPDYGMMTQAWNIYSYAVPVVEQFFGIRPRAYAQHTRIQPQFPATWDEGRLENIKIGENEISVSFLQSDESLNLTILQALADWTIELAFPKGKYQNLQLNGKGVSPIVRGNFDIIETTGSNLSLEAR
ncbi:alpha-L-rhamnosidase-related protein [Catalinimonas niigatensis]|uniref:alpha-L-rhamnosidase-related protein n=1 Tax=Catalinimonas niigatensis TaxID=1397264 RepID=UPI0026660F89|nr:glycogen debranching protein [Catalinimonas niigatensis]WPP48441.1 glycogen debranching protein [Catalinimonas niigatensis]